jgi:macrolide transport system ATP-binding/permease protein
MNLLKDLHHRGHTIILVTHDPKVASAAQRQIRIMDGRIVEDTGRTPIAHPKEIAGHGQ